MTKCFKVLKNIGNNVYLTSNYLEKNILFHYIFAIHGQHGTLPHPPRAAYTSMSRAASSPFKPLRAALSCIKPLRAPLSPFKFALCCFKLLRAAYIHFEKIGDASNCLELL